MKGKYLNILFPDVTKLAKKMDCIKKGQLPVLRTKINGFKADLAKLII
jgi:hypothetical protein